MTTGIMRAATWAVLLHQCAAVERDSVVVLSSASGPAEQGRFSVIDCVDAVAHHVTTTQTLDRSVVSSLWAIVHIGRAWGLHPDGMLRRNDLITVEDQATLADWLDSLSERILHMLGCQHDPSAPH